ncbi:MAG: hypothetical protein OQK82_01555 [Candidatus Pacearchaeota archaeon]|nr:hypothetical protein [Candidatus Pacearchaeota archaeon]
MTLLNSALPTFSQDAVAIFPGTRSIPIPGAPSFLSIPGFVPIQVFASARPVSVRVREYSDFMTHPLEEGSEVTDHKIVRPVELELAFILKPEDYKKTYALIKVAYLLGIRFTVQTKTDLYPNQFIQEMPHEEDPELFDTITMVISFREVQFFASDIQVLGETQVTDVKDQSTVSRGLQQTSTATASQANSGSTLFRLFGGG